MANPSVVARGEAARAALLRALGDGPLGQDALSERTGVRRSSVGYYMAQLAQAGAVERWVEPNVGGGEFAVYGLPGARPEGAGPTREALMRLMRERGPMTVPEVAEVSGINVNTVSGSLRQLARQGALARWRPPGRSPSAIYGLPEQRPDGAGWNVYEAVVAAALRAPGTVAELTKRTGYGRTSVSRALDEAVRRRELGRRRGRWGRPKGK